LIELSKTAGGGCVVSKTAGGGCTTDSIIGIDSSTAITGEVVCFAAGI
jgi:hypothetical protein